jgi:hypothetical protein
VTNRTTERQPSLGARVLAEWRAEPTLPPRPEFPLAALPEPAIRLCEETAHSMSVPIDMVGVACLGAMTACTSGRFVVQIDPDWTVGTSAYFVVLWRSGGKKSPTMKLVYQPLRDVQAELHEWWSVQNRDARGPSPRVLLRGNATGEGLGLRWAETGGKAHIADSEGAWWSILAGRYSKNPTWDELLSGWDGDVYEVTRAGRPSFVVEEAWLSLCTLVQPAAMADLVGQRRADDLGLLARLLTAAPADVPIDVHAAPVSTMTLGRWGSWLSMCARTFWGRQHAARIRMLPDARALLREVQQQYVDAAGKDGPLHAWPAWASKAAGHVVSLAGILSRCNRVHGTGYEQPLTAVEVADGASLMEYFARMLPHSFVPPDGPAQEAAKRLSGWIGRQKGEWTRQMAWQPHREGRERFDIAADLQPALDWLVDVGAIEVSGQSAATGDRKADVKWQRYRVVRKDRLP